jgi:hypothetical protein
VACERLEMADWCARCPGGLWLAAVLPRSLHFGPLKARAYGRDDSGPFASERSRVRLGDLSLSGW